MNHYAILSGASESQISLLASQVLEAYPKEQVRLLSGPQRGLIMLRVRETVADSQFNGGEVLVTEVKLELAGQFGYAMVIGDSPRRALAIALLDAALRKGDALAAQLKQEIAVLSSELRRQHQQVYKAVATTQVNFEVF